MVQWAATATVYPSRVPAVLIAVLLAGCVGSVSPSAIPASNPPRAVSTPPAPSSSLLASTSSPRPVPSGAPDTTFDLRGTAWRLLELPGQPLSETTTPTIEIAPFARGEPPGSPRIWSTGFDGCSDFGFTGTFENGRAELNVDGAGPPVRCAVPAVRDAFVGLFRASTSWAVYGDVLVLSGPSGHLQLTRLVPPPGDPGRALAEALRSDFWRIASATGITTLARYAPARFSDRHFGASGECGFGGEIRFGLGGAVKIENAGFDTTVCAEGAPGADQRPALMALLGEVTSGVLESPDRVRLVGPAGELLLTRGLASTFTTRNSTLRFTADNGVPVAVEVLDGSGWLTRSAKGTPFQVADPSDQDVWIVNADGDETALRIEWVASGGCRSSYRLTIEPSARRLWIEQLTPQGGDSLGGNCDLTLHFSRPVPAERVEGKLLFPA